MDRHEWDARYAAGRVWSVEPNRFVVDEVGDLPPGRALDLACGEGRNAVWLASLGWTVTAVDFSEVAVERGRGLSSDVEWIVDDVLTWTPAGEPAYDLVLVVYLQLPAAERRRVLTSAAGLLADGGSVVVVAHHADNLTQGVGGPSDPAVLFSETDAAADLAAAGLDVVRAERVLRPVDGAAAVDVLVRALRPPARS